MRVAKLAMSINLDYDDEVLIFIISGAPSKKLCKIST
jgi:hypothetical protein